MRSAAAGATVTAAPWRATATTSATESGEPSRTTTGPPVVPGGGVTAAFPPPFPDRSAGLVLGCRDDRHLARGIEVDRHRNAVLARLGMAPRTQQPRPRRVERHGESPGIRGNLQAEVGLPVALQRRRVDAHLFRDPTEAHAVR